MICNCCSGVGIETPQTVANRSGLPAIAYRAGTWATFKASMLASLGGATAHGLRTRNDDDFTIAFLDACAVVGDILTFYDERIANENYLRTATELLSLGELARLIGYRPGPGCSASAYLAFRLNDPPPSPRPSSLARLSSALGAIVPAGTKTQSVPGPGQVPQTFETSADLDARWVHNALAPLLGLAYWSGDTAPSSIFVASGSAGTVGQSVLLVSASAGTAAIHTITTIVVDPATKIAQLFLDGYTPPAPVPPGTPPSPSLLLAIASSYPANASFTSNDDPFGDVIVQQIVAGFGWDHDQLATAILREQWSTDAFEASVNAQNAAARAGTDLSAFTVKTAALFGNNAPLWAALPVSLTQAATATTPAGVYSEDWDTGDTLGSYTGSSYYSGSQIDLDNVYASAVPGATVIFSDYATSTTIAATIASSVVVTRTIYALSARVTSITVTVDASGGDPGSLHPRTTAVFIQDARLPLEPMPIYGPGQYVTGSSVLLDRCALQLGAGRSVAITGTRYDQQGVTSTEIALLASVSLENGYTLLTFEQPMTGTYLPETVAINANVVAATNGEAVNETLGSGNAGQTFQTFTLKQAPLTWTSAAVPRGIAAAIAVSVNGIAWTLVPYLYGSGPTDRVFTLDSDVKGNTVVKFGDGITGARLPTGIENVTAAYRRGLGAAANVDAAEITMLITRPPGLRDVTNPVAASGGDDPDSVADSRANAPYSVKTLGRIVTLEDYSDFARAGAGIAKARVDLTWIGATQVVLVTVAGPDGAQIVTGSNQYNDLLAALQGASDGSYPIFLASYQPITFSAGVALVTDPTMQATAVYAAVQSALFAAFSFDARDFGQPVFASELYGVIQSVPGVIASNLTAFCYTQTVPPAITDPLIAQPAQISGATAAGAQLLTIDTIPASLTVLS
jgi:uncharacterized phage protein gp47/JayE